MTADAPGVGYLSGYAAALQEWPQLHDVRVVGVLIDGEPVAVPHDILWYHELVNQTSPHKTAPSPILHQWI